MCKKEYVNFQTNKPLDVNEVEKLKDNSLLKYRPELWKYWNFKKNDELGIDIWKVTKGSEKEAWWNCPRCNKVFQRKISKLSNKNRICKCYPLVTEYDKSISFLNNSVLKEWDYSKNIDINPDEMGVASNKKVWWKCKEGHEWQTSPNARLKTNCPFCPKPSSRKVTKGVNDLWTTHPHVASLLANHQDGYEYSRGSDFHLNWKCNCGETIKNKTVANVVNKGLCCPVCSDGLSYAEKIVYTLLKSLNIEFFREKKFEWSENRRYDFYIPSLNLIIETHGLQHYEEGFKNIKAKSLQDEQENDKIKREIALNNNIDNYIELDCRESNISWIRESILKSDLRNMVNLKDVDWGNISLKSSKSMTLRCADLWNSGINSVLKISKILNIGRMTVRKNLIKMADIGYCDYDVKTSKNKFGNRVKVVKFDFDMNPIKIYDSISDAARDIGTSTTTISKYCKGIFTCDNYIWKFEKDIHKKGEDIK